MPAMLEDSRELRMRQLQLDTTASCQRALDDRRLHHITAPNTLHHCHTYTKHTHSITRDIS